jgi:hypothetical protein
MKIQTALFLSGMLLIGCRSQRQPEAEIQPEEYAVFSAVLDSCYDAYVLYKRQVILLSAYTVIPPRCQTGFPSQWPPVAYAPGFERPEDDLSSQDTTENAILNRLQDDVPSLEWATLRRSFAALNVHRYRLDTAKLSIARSLSLFDSSASSIKALWESGVHLEPESKTGRPAAVSRVAFNSTLDQALVYYIEEGDGFSEWYLALTKEKSHWIVRRGRGHAGI